MLSHRTSPQGVRIVGLLTATVLGWGGLVTGLAPVAGAAGFDPATACPAPAPTPGQVAALLKDVDERAVKLSAAEGLYLWAMRDEPGPDGTTTSEIWNFVGHPASGKSRWWTDGSVSDADGRGIPALRPPSTDHVEDAKNRRHYRRIVESDVTGPLDWAALAGLREDETWLRTTPGVTKAWPPAGYRPLLATFAGRIRTDLPDATFSCTADDAAEPGLTLVDVVATSGDDSRTLRIQLRTADGGPEHFTLTGAEDTDPEASGGWSFGASAGSVRIPARSVSPAAYRTAATQALVRELRDGYILPEAGPAIARERTPAGRVAALRSVSAKLNARFLRDLRDQGAGSVTSTARAIKNGKKYTVRYGDAAASVTVTVKGSKVSTATAVTASSSTAAPADALLPPANRAASSGAFDPATLCPAEPTLDQLASVLDGLQHRMTEKSRTTGVSTSVIRTRDAVRESWSFRGDPVTGRAVSGHRARWDEDVTYTFLDEGTYVDPQGRRSYRLISADHQGGDRLKKAALDQLDRSRVWHRTSTGGTRSWPPAGYVPAIRTYAHRLLLDHPGATFTCLTSGSTLTTVTATEPGEESGEEQEPEPQLRIRVDADGAPVSFAVADGYGRWRSSGTVLYQRPRLWRPVLDHTSKQIRQAAVGGAASYLRSKILTAAKEKVARASSNAKRVAALRTISARVNGDVVRWYDAGSSTSFTTSAKKVTNGKKYTLRVGPDAVGHVTFTIKGKKIVTKVSVPKVS